MRLTDFSAVAIDPPATWAWERAMARKTTQRRSLLWRLAKWCGFSSPLVIIVAVAGRFLGIDTSWFLDAESSQGRAFIQAISKAAQDRDGRSAVEPPARVVRHDFQGPLAPAGRPNDWRPPPPPTGIAPPAPRTAGGANDTRKVVDRRNKEDDFSFPSPQIRR